MQISAVTAIGLLLALTVARNITITIISMGLICLVITFALAKNHRISSASYVFLGSMSAMLFALAITGAGLLDLAVLGFPGILIFGALLGGSRLFLWVFAMIIAQCVAITWMTMEGFITPFTPKYSWPHLIFVITILTITGFCVFILARDIRNLMQSLEKENVKVQESQARIQHLAHHDTLTNLPNRMYGEHLFGKHLGAAVRLDIPLAVVFIDLDNFKPVNDALGHAAGDELLKQLTARLSDLLKPEQSLVRFGGDEFLVITKVDNGEQEIKTLAERLIVACSTPFEILDTQVAVSASVGIALAPEHDSEFKALCRKADLAMYVAKDDGKNTFRFYDPTFNTSSDERFNLLQQLRPAVEHNEFSLYYQPLYCLKSGKLDTLEALLRWPKDDGSMVSPAQFIPVAESSGLITVLGKWVIEEACRYCATLRSQGYPNLKIAVNLSAVQFKDGTIKQTVMAALQAANLPADGLEIELTESSLIDDTDQIQQQLKSLSDLGVSVAIDDFGTGYSNLGYLRAFSASKLKIDRSFIKTVCIGEYDESLVQAIINMASSLGMETVAEGIEDKKTLDKLITMGCNIGQGFYWSKPLPPEELMGYLSDTSKSKTV